MVDNKEKQAGIADNLPDDPESLKRIIHALVEDDAHNAHLQEEALNGMKSLISSWRWRIGHGVMSIVEKALGRKNVRLAADQILAILNQLSSQSRKRAQLGTAYLENLTAGITFYTGEKAKEEYTRVRKEELDTFLSSEERLDFSLDEPPTASILLVLFNRAELTLACLRSIKETVGFPAQLVIVDNASSDQTGQLLERIDGASIIRNDANEGFLKACNKGSEVAEGEYLLFLNNDAVLIDESLAKAIQVFKDEPGVGAVGGKILLLDGSLQEAGSIVWNDGSCLGYGRTENQFHPEYMFRRDVDYCSGAFLLVRTGAFVEMGGFDEAYVPAYYEETDFCLRLHEKGHRLIYDPNISVLHYEFASTKKSDEAITLQKTNRKTFVGKHSGYLSTKFAPSETNILQARFAERKRKILYIDDRVPHQYFGSGFPRSNFILNTLEEQGFQVTLYPLNFPHEDSWDTVYSDIPKSVEVMLGHGRAELEGHLKSRKGYYDVIFISRPHNMEFFRQAGSKMLSGPDRPKVIYDAEAIFSLRDAAKYEIFSGKKHSNVENNIRSELELVEEADEVVAVSSKERKVFCKYFDGPVSVVGHAMDIDPTPAQFDERKGFLFVGNMDYDGSPNVDSMTWFVEHVFPLVQKKIPDANLVLVGPDASSEIQALASERIQVKGRQPDLKPFYNSARVFLAPTRFAGGIPYKIHEAASMGIPVVCTELLRQQLVWENCKEVLAAEVNDPEKFAQHCIALHQESDLWEAVRNSALETISRECSVDIIKERIKKLFNGH